MILDRFPRLCIYAQCSYSASLSIAGEGSYHDIAHTAQNHAPLETYDMPLPASFFDHLMRYSVVSDAMGEMVYVGNLDALRRAFCVMILSTAQYSA